MDLIDKDPQLVRAYLRDPASVSLRRKLSARIVARVQSELDHVLTCRRRHEEQRLAEARKLYRMGWALGQMQAVLSCQAIHQAFSREEYQELMDRHDALQREREAFVRDRPRWSGEIGMDRWDAQRLERVLFEERQAVERMRPACRTTPNADRNISPLPDDLAEERSVHANAQPRRAAHREPGS